MKLETPFIALILSGLLFTGLFTMFISIADENNVEYNTTIYGLDNNEINLEDAFNNINETKTEMDKTTSQFYNQSVEDSGSLFGFVKYVHVTSKQIFGNLTLLKNIFSLIGQVFGVDGAVISTFTSILLLVFVISAIMILMGRSYG